MKVAKSFGWEAAHRLPTHQGLCRNLHGHSYRMRVEMEGEPDEDGIVVDFQDIKKLVKPLVDKWDHSILAAESDAGLRELAGRLGDRLVVLPFETTAENLCRFFADYVVRHGATVLESRGIVSVRVRIHETETCFAEYETTLA